MGHRIASVSLVALAATFTLAFATTVHAGDAALWTPASLLRGPTAIANAPLVPFRTAAGGTRVALDDPVEGTKRKVLLVPLLAVAGGGMGLVDAGVWLAAGLADTVTGGWFALAPEQATHFSVAPITPHFASH
jgi:hypothetical protein